MAKDEYYNKLIHSNRWAQLRKQILSAHPICQECQKAGRLQAATEVHHVRPVEEALFKPDKLQRMFDAHNLQALCHDCHVKIHTQLGRSGKEATKKRNHDLTEQAIKKFFGSD